VGFSGLKYLAAGPSWVSGFGPYNNNLGGGEDPKMKTWPDALAFLFFFAGLPFEKKNGVLVAVYTYSCS
jgi:hypothetical protein